MNARRHGWQRPLHPYQVLGMAIYCFLVASFYCFLGLFLGNKIAEIVMCSVFGAVAASVMFLFIRCAALDPTDKTRLRKKKKGKSKGLSNLNYGVIIRQLITKMVRRIEHKILTTWIRRKYLGPTGKNVQNEPLLPFPFVTPEDMVTPDPKDDDISFCTLCDFEVKQHSKHCRTCNRCVEGFDHHCKWLNNCVGKKNYTTFFLMMVFVLLLLSIEGGTAIAVFVRCFADKNGMERELAQRHYVKFPRGVLAAIAVLLVLVTAYGLAALGQLFFFHVVLIKKGLRTYEYILAMKEANQSQFQELDDSDWSSDDSSEFEESPTKPMNSSSKFVSSREKAASQSPGRLTIKIDPESESTSAMTKKSSLSVSINPWRLMKMSQTKAMEVADKAKEILVKQKTPIEHASLYPLPFETRNGPLINAAKSSRPKDLDLGRAMGPIARVPGSPGRFSSPRRRFSVSPSIMLHKSNFELKLGEAPSPVVKDEHEEPPR